jgi:hypothetical protein
MDYNREENAGKYREKEEFRSLKMKRQKKYSILVVFE